MPAERCCGSSGTRTYVIRIEKEADDASCIPSRHRAGGADHHGGRLWWRLNPPRYAARVTERRRAYPDSGGCGGDQRSIDRRRQAFRYDNDGTLDVNGVSRKAIVYVPAGRSAGKPAPAVVVLHGAPGSGIEIEYDTNMNVEADRLGFIAVYPDGTQSGANQYTHWNDGRPVWGTMQPPDDVGFMAKLFDLLIAKYTIDPSRISAAGFSNGAFMAARLTCELSDGVAAIAVVAGPRDDSACPLKRPLSVLVVHGTADANEPYAGGPDLGGIPVPAEAEVVGFWRTHDGCAAQPATSMVSSNVQLQTYGSCQGGTEVRFYTVQNGTHCWPGAGSAPACTQSVTWNATPAIADFLLAHPILGASAP